MPSSGLTFVNIIYGNALSENTEYKIPVSFMGDGTDLFLNTLAGGNENVAANLRLRETDKVEVFNRVPKEIDQYEPDILGYVVCFNPKDLNSAETVKQYINGILSFKEKREANNNNSLIAIALVAVSHAPVSDLPAEEQGDIALGVVTKDISVVNDAKSFAEKNHILFFDFDRLDKKGADAVVATIVINAVKVENLKKIAIDFYEEYKRAQENRLFQPSAERNDLVARYVKEALRPFVAGNDKSTQDYIRKTRELIKESDELHQKEGLLGGAFTTSSFSEMLTRSAEAVETLDRQIRANTPIAPSIQSTSRPS